MIELSNWGSLCGPESLKYLLSGPYRKCVKPWCKALFSQPGSLPLSALGITIPLFLSWFPPYYWSWAHILPYDPLLSSQFPLQSKPPHRWSSGRDSLNLSQSCSQGWVFWGRKENTAHVIWGMCPAYKHKTDGSKVLKIPEVLFFLSSCSSKKPMCFEYFKLVNEIQVLQSIFSLASALCC